MNQHHHQFENLAAELASLGVSDHDDDDETDSDTDSEFWTEPSDDDADTVSEPEEVEILPPPGFRARPLNPNDIPAIHGMHGGFAQDIEVPEVQLRVEDETDTEDEEE